MFGIKKTSNLLDEIRRERALKEELRDAKTEPLERNKYYKGYRKSQRNLGKDIISGFNALHTVGKQFAERASPVQRVRVSHVKRHKNKSPIVRKKRTRVSYYEEPMEEQREGLFDFPRL
jgi:hypothetical protein